MIASTHPRRLRLVWVGLSALMGICFLAGCIAYWPRPESDGCLRPAVKDLIDMKGLVTTGGSEYLAKNRHPAARDAECLEAARSGGVWIVGKTNAGELAALRLGEIQYRTGYADALKRRPELKRAFRKVFEIQNTVAVNLAGNPALALPIPMEDKMVHVTSPQLVGPPFSEAELLHAGQLVESRLPK